MGGKAAFFIACCFFSLEEEPPEPDKDPTLKKVTKQFKVASVDPRTRLLSVKEKGYEVYWDKNTTFLHHRSILLKDLPKDAVLQFFGKRHEKKAGGTVYEDTDPLISDVEYLGLGDGFQQPPLTSQKSGVVWQEGRLTVARYPYSLEVDGKEYRLSGSNKMAAYSMDKLEPQKFAGKTALIHGYMKKVKVERDGKQVEVTRVYASEVHLVELLPEHMKVFQLQWGDRKKAEEASKGAKK